MQTMLMQEMFTSASLTAMPVLSSTNLDQFSAISGGTMQVHAGGARLSSDSNTNGWRGWLQPPNNTTITGVLTPTMPTSPYYLQCFGFVNFAENPAIASSNTRIIGATNPSGGYTNTSPLIGGIINSPTGVLSLQAYHGTVTTVSSPVLLPNVWYCPMLLLYQSGTYYAAELYLGIVAANGTLTFSLVATAGTVASPIQGYDACDNIVFNFASGGSSQLNGSLAAASVYQIDSFATGAAGIDPSIIIPNYTPLTYYLMPNTSGASDNNDGTTITRPWLTCAWTNTNTANGGLLGTPAKNGGDSLVVDLNGTAFKADSNIQIQSPGTTVTMQNWPSGLSTWGWGTMPGSFTQPNSGTYPNLWQGTIPETVVDSNGNTLPQILENRIYPTAISGTTLTTTVEAAINTTPGACFVVAAAPTVAYFSPNTVGDNPNTNGKTYWYTRNIGSVVLNAPFTGITCDNTVKIGGFSTVNYTGNPPYSGGNYFFIDNTNTNSDEITIDGGSFDNSGKHAVAQLGVRTNSTVNWQNIDSEQAVPRFGGSIHFVIYGGTNYSGELNNIYNLKNVNTKLSSASPGSTTGVAGGPAGAYISHSTQSDVSLGVLNIVDSDLSGGFFDPEGVFDLITIRNSKIATPTIGPSTQISRSTIIGAAPVFTGSTGSWNLNPVFDIQNSIYVGSGSNSGGLAGSVTYRRCLFDARTATSGGSGTILQGSPAKLVIENCIILFPITGIAFVFSFLYKLTSSCQITMRNNIYVTYGGAQSYNYIVQAWQGTNGNNLTLAQWQALGYDSGSIIVVASGLAENYMPTINFPGNFTAVQDGIFEDFDGVLYTNRKTIGPYEYNGSIMVPPNLGLSPGPMGIVSGYAG